MKFECALLLLGAWSPRCLALPRAASSTTSREPADGIASVGQRRLNGKFLHITDIHPDPFYKVYTSTDDEHACHRGRGPAGYYGAETSDCDTPVHLVDATFKWIEENLKDEIDFIIWTGDSAKHDNDDQIPRTRKQVKHQNRLIADKFAGVFGEGKHGKKGFSIPIVPTLGNNDVLPHNIFKQGPNKWTKTYLDIWKTFIPQDQKEDFAKGGYFSVEVIPNHLVVISLNTLYFFDSNLAVNGCVAKSEPGYKHFEWLRAQLDGIRQRGMKVMLIGHVPPARVDSKTDWVESCWQKYTLWQQQYRDIIVGSFYGHMNIDHFMLQDFKNIKKSFKNGKASARDIEADAVRGGTDELSISSAKDYLNDLRSYFAKIPSFSINDGVHDQREEGDDDFEDSSSWLDNNILSLFKKNKKKPKDPLDKIGGQYGERYSLTFVGPSIVPNYFPTLRVFEYNTTGLETATVAAPMDIDDELAERSLPDQFFLHEDELEDITENDIEAEKKSKKKAKFKVPKGPSKSALPGPAYSPQPLSLVSITQYFANLTHINNDFANALETEEDDDVSDERWKEGKHKGKVKKGKPHPRKFAFHVEYSTAKDKIFGLKDLTVRSYIDLAKSIGDSEKRGSAKIWHTFIKRAFVGAFDPKEIEKQFGLSNVTATDGEGGAASLEL